MAHMAFAIWPTLLFFGLISATGSFVEDQSGLAGGSAVVESSLQSVSFDRAGKQHSGGSVLQGNPSDAGALSSNGLSSRARASSVARDPHTGSSLLLLTQEPNGLSAPTVDNAEARSSPATILALSPAAFLEKSLFQKKDESAAGEEKAKDRETQGHNDDDDMDGHIDDDDMDGHIDDDDMDGHIDDDDMDGHIDDDDMDGHIDDDDMDGEAH
ncbi:conserved hypothetical protein [Neospora caninum Liverpool]|uniref:Uncharacterized protein n=1 Tax=Neospora caninum (strain Liverpool) TaxID=572307 RepID=F0VR00_NEOCL|nr:conserved hypothetical protein [Neospora caninum Liverpool]CBZ56147.1 conserved hypothetical protein [Neospora caninum Liverpool]|eukprot:XP_003886173.1 conserved hypothetical protein [Neospora caninum Liverpool]